MNNFVIPPNHSKFKAKKLAENIEGDILDCSVAYIEPNGGGPIPSHTHSHNHFFIVVEGCATIKIGKKKVKVQADESILVSGAKVHSVWNESDEILKMIGITIEPQ